VIGREAREQARGGRRLPEAVVACVGAARTRSDLHGFLADEDVRLLGSRQPARLTRNRRAACSRCPSSILADEDGRSRTRTRFAGLDIRRRPEHAYLRDSARDVVARPSEALQAFADLASTEGSSRIEPAHALARAVSRRSSFCLSLGRGDKDLAECWPSERQDARRLLMPSRNAGARTRAVEGGADIVELGFRL